MGFWFGGDDDGKKTVMELYGLVKKTDMHQVVHSEVLVRFGEVDSWMEDNEKTENQEMGIWEREGVVWFDGDDDGKKMMLVLRGSVLVRFGEVDSWIEDDEKTENQEMGIWESEGAIWFGGDDDGKKMVMLLRGLVKKTDMKELFGLVELRDDEKVFVRFGEVDSWMEDDEKTENQDICIWEREGAVRFGGDDDGKKTEMVLCGS
ncbi:hypothetical protein AAC387_Pa10g0716 [Persea americana]